MLGDSRPVVRVAIPIVVIAALGLAALFAWPVYSGESSASEAAPGGMAVHGSPRPVPDLAFQNGSGDEMSLSDFRGKVVVLNIWATWCPPCREEMPTLDALQDELGGDRFEVVALSVDQAGPQVVRDFYAEIEIEQLALYIDSSMQAMVDLGVRGIPTTLVLDRNGREIARLVGKADWATPEMLEYFRDLIERRSNGES